MLRRTFAACAAFALLLSLFATSASAAGGDVDGIREADGTVELLSTYQAGVRVGADGEKLVPVIIKLDEMAAASYDGSIEGLAPTSPAVLGTDRFNAASPDTVAYLDYLRDRHAVFEAQLARAVPQAEVTRSFEIVIGGVAALVPRNAIDRISNLDGVVAVYRDELNKLDTEVSPGFIGATGAWTTLGGKDVAGEGVIVGVIDSGIWPEHPSVSDPDPAGNPYPAPPVVPGSNGILSGDGSACSFGDVGFNPDDAPFTCNNKLIGAYDFTDTYKLVIGLISTEFDSARDSNGHGTHTLTTAAGNGGVDATLLGVARGTVSGISPRSHTIMYKGCGLLGCFSSDTSAGVAQAILDGVDVMNYSISGGGSPYSDTVSLAFWDAYNAGILVNPSAGNSGPGADTVAHREPWTLTVGASTTDRHFLSTVTLTSSTAADLVVTGASVTAGISTSTPVVYAGDFGDALCLTPFAPGTFSGEIVICDRGVIARVEKSFNVSEGGAGGLILVNTAPIGLATDNHFIPSVHLEFADGVAVKAYEAGESDVEATFTDGVSSTVIGDSMAAFSSRGGPGQTLGVSKPDVTAPGVQILAGHTPLPEDSAGGLPGELFQSIQGTSMSAPHSTGASALVKAAHPDWGPGQIKSALMTTARRAGVTKEDGATPGDYFDYGSGRIRPNVALRSARATISETGANFLALEDSLWDSNYPSLYIPNLAGAVTVSRTLHNETNNYNTWIATAHSPTDIKVRVHPRRIVLGPKIGPFANGSFDIHVDARDVPLGEVRFADITLRKGSQKLFFPITIVKGEAGVTIDKSCAPTTIALGGTTTCDITVTNNTFDPQLVDIRDRLPRQLRVVSGSVVGGLEVTPKLVTSTVALAPLDPPDVVTAVDNFASPAGYLDLTAFTPTDVGATDESIANFGVPTFEYNGVSYDTLGIVSNGYVIPGGGTGADVDFINSDLPDPAIPNNVIAPFWTDLNPSAGGTVWIELLTNGFDSWIVVEWQSVPNFGDGEANTAQVWLGYDTDADPSQDISFTYSAESLDGPGPSDGDGGFLTVGAEGAFGVKGDTTYFDGVGDPPAPSFGGDSSACDGAWPAFPPCYEVDVSSVPGAAGGVATVSFDATGTNLGEWWNYASLTGAGIIGTAYASEHGEVTP